MNWNTQTVKVPSIRAIGLSGRIKRARTVKAVQALSGEAHRERADNRIDAPDLEWLNRLAIERLRALAEISDRKAVR